MLFDNNDRLEFQDNQLIYERIRDSDIHMIVARPAVLPYNDAVRWIVDHANPKDRSFNTSTRSLLANFRYETFVNIYALKPFTQLLNAYFVKVAKSMYNFEQMLKFWMAEPHKFS